MTISEWAYTDVISSLMGLSVAGTSISINTAVMSSSELAFVRRFSKAAESNLSAESTICSQFFSLLSFSAALAGQCSCFLLSASGQAA
jgi:hypothetical protein